MSDIQAQRGLKAAQEPQLARSQTQELQLQNRPSWSQGGTQLSLCCFSPGFPDLVCPEITYSVYSDIF